MQAPGRVAGLDVDEEVVADARTSPEAGGAQHARQAAQHARLHAQLEVVHRVAQALEIGR